MPDPVRTFRHFRDVPAHLWRWKNFSPAEIACRGTGHLKLHPEALDRLQALRDRLGKPLIVRSAYRSLCGDGLLRGLPHGLPAKVTQVESRNGSASCHAPFPISETPVSSVLPILRYLRAKFVRKSTAICIIR